MLARRIIQTDTIILSLPNRCGTRIQFTQGPWSRAVLLILTTRPRYALTQRRPHHGQKCAQCC